jgi:hypothetical protein
MTPLGGDALDEELVRRVAATAAERGETVDDVIVRALTEYVSVPMGEAAPELTQPLP